MKKITIVSYGGKERASTRYRLLNLIPFLESKEVSYKILKGNASYTGISKIDKEILESIRILYEAKRSERVHIQKMLPKKRTVDKIKGESEISYDFDDAIYASCPWVSSVSSRKVDKLKYLLKNCNKVLVGSQKLKHFANKYCQNVKVVPTPVKKKKKIKSYNRNTLESITIGWIGHPDNLWYLENILHELDKAFSDKNSHRLKVVSKYNERFRKLLNRNYVEFEEWSLQKESRQIRSFDLAIRPLTNDEWSVSKGGFTSVVQCMSYGVPVIASRVDGLKNLISDTKSGLLIEDKNDWKNITKINDASILKSMSKNALCELEENGMWLCQKGHEMADFICT